MSFKNKVRRDRPETNLIQYPHKEKTRVIYQPLTDDAPTVIEPGDDKLVDFLKAVGPDVYDPEKSTAENTMNIITYIVTTMGEKAVSYQARIHALSVALDTAIAKMELKHLGTKKLEKVLKEEGCDISKSKEATSGSGTTFETA